MDALQRVHRALRARGVVLDIHEEPEDPPFKVWRDGRIAWTGQLPQPVDNQEVRETRARVASVLSERWYALERELVVKGVQRYESVDGLLRGREAMRAPRAAELVERMRAALAEGGELVVRPRARATLLRRLPRPRR